MIHVCSLARLHDTVDDDRRAPCRHPAPSTTTSAARPASIAADDHLLPATCTTSPSRSTATSRPDDEHVERLVDFVRGWDRAAPLVIHCYAGISRSTAAPSSPSARSTRSATRRRSRGRCAAPRRPPRPTRRIVATRRRRCSAATAAWSRRSQPSAAARSPTRASRSGSISSDAHGRHRRGPAIEIGLTAAIVAVEATSR